MSFATSVTKRKRGLRALAKRERFTVILILILLLAVALFAWQQYFEHAFLALPYNDAMDYASIARNIAEGKGVVSSYLTPLSLAHAEEPYPNIWRAPLWPIILAASFSFFGFTDQVAASTSGFFYIAALVPLVLLGRKLAGSLVAFWAGLLYIFSPASLYYSISGMTEPLAAFLMLLWLFLLWKAAEKGGHFLFWAGAAGGFFYLARYNALVFIAISFLFLAWIHLREKSAAGKTRTASGSPASAAGGSFPGAWEGIISGAPGGSPFDSVPGRSPGIGGLNPEVGEKAPQKRGLFPQLLLYFGGWLLVAFPWLYRNAALFGNPFFALQKYELAMFTPTYPGYTLYMLPEKIAPLSFLRENPGELQAKIAAGLETFSQNILDPGFTGIALFLIPLFFLSPLFPRHRGIKLFVLACFLIHLAALLGIHYIPRLFFLFVPLYAIIALDFGKNLSDLLKKPLVSCLLVSLLAAGGILSNLPDWEEENSWYDWPEDFDSAIAHAQEMVPQDGVIVSNDGHFLSWYADRTTVKLPHRIAQLENIEERAPVKGIYLSFRMLFGNTPEAHPEWLEVLENRPEELAGYRLYHAYGNGSLLYLEEHLVED